jgi:copper chaperone CopZ
VCAHAVSVSLKAVSGVDSVQVNLEKGLAVAKLKPGNNATLKQLNEAITKNGFTMKDSTAAVAGTVLSTDGKATLHVSGSNDVLHWNLSREPHPLPQWSARLSWWMVLFPRLKKAKHQIQFVISRLRKNDQNENRGSDHQQTLSPPELPFPLHFWGHIALLCPAFGACALRPGIIRGINAFICALARHALSAQAVDVRYFWGLDRIELFQHVLHRPTNSGEPGVHIRKPNSM